MAELLVFNYLTVWTQALSSYYTYWHQNTVIIYTLNFWPLFEFMAKLFKFNQVLDTNLTQYLQLKTLAYF